MRNLASIYKKNNNNAHVHNIPGASLRSEGRTTLNLSMNGVVVDSLGKKTNKQTNKHVCDTFFESLGKFVSHESGIL